jgi:hypothetical protein
LPLALASAAAHAEERALGSDTGLRGGESLAVFKGEPVAASESESPGIAVLISNVDGRK